VNQSNIFDVQLSTPVFQKQPDLTMKRYEAPSYVNKRMHIITTTAERALELMRAVYPEAIVHQIIKRSALTDVIVDPLVVPHD